MVDQKQRLENNLKLSLEKNVYHYHPEAFKKSERKPKMWHQGFTQYYVDVTCPYCGKSWTAVERSGYTCGRQGGRNGCGYKFKRSY